MLKWTVADIYGPTKTRQILKTKHMKSALEVHITTAQALFDLYVEEFFQEHPHLRSPCTQSEQQVAHSCHLHNREEMKVHRIIGLLSLSQIKSWKPSKCLMRGKKPKFQCSSCSALHVDDNDDVHIYLCHPLCTI